MLTEWDLGALLASQENGEGKIGRRRNCAIGKGFLVFSPAFQMILEYLFLQVLTKEIEILRASTSKIL